MTARPLHAMFTQVPPSYDLLNRLLTFRLDERWRKTAAEFCLAKRPKSILDLCTGTGDLALRLQQMAARDTRIAALDYSMPMLCKARLKAQKWDIEGIGFIHGDAARMPFPDDQFDAIGMAFACRNLTFRNPDRDTFLSEIIRILKPGGRLVIIETSQPQNAFIRFLFHAYLEYLTVPIGGLISGHYGAYKYLAHSAKNYYHSAELADLLRESGFSKVTHFPRLLGISTL